MKKSSHLYNLDILIYNRIKFFSEKDMMFFESNKTLSNKFDRHVNRISSSINKLIKLGYIKNNGKNKFERRLVITKKELNINGVSNNINGVTFNISSVEVITVMLKGLNINGVENLTKAVLELNINGDLYKYFNKVLLNKYFKEETNTKDIPEQQLEDIKNIWNEFAEYNNLSKIKKLSQKRKVAILQRKKEEEFDLQKILDCIEDSSFLLGKSKDGWKVDFDFVFGSANNYLKILEGNYKNKGGHNERNTGINKKEFASYFE